MMPVNTNERNEINRIVLQRNYNGEQTSIDRHVYYSVAVVRTDILVSDAWRKVEKKKTL